jgi:hypothetical protein
MRLDRQTLRAHGVILTAAFSITFISCGASAGAAVTMEQFEVDSHILGPRRLYISDKVIRIDCLRENLTIISKKPFDKATCFNNSSRKICDQDATRAVKELRTFGLFMSEAGEVTLSWKRSGPETVQGVPCIAYNGKVTHTEKMPNKADEADWRKYWVRNDLVVPKPAGDILSAAIGAPNIPGIPQRLEHFGSENDFNIPFLSRSNIDTQKKILRVIISTKSRKKVSVPDSFFDLPKNYKRKDDFKKVFLGSGGMQSLKDAGKAPGFLFESK